MNENIIKELRDSLPASLIQYVDEVETLIMDGKYREAYLKMYEIKNNPLWHPTSEYLQLMENFWWNYAN